MMLAILAHPNLLPIKMLPMKEGNAIDIGPEGLLLLQQKIALTTNPL